MQSRSINNNPVVITWKSHVEVEIHESKSVGILTIINVQLK